MHTPASQRTREPIATGALPARRFVLHADDFGMNDAVTDGILEGFRNGLLTSTSVLANAPGCARALAQWKTLQSQRAAGAVASCAARQLLADSMAPFDLGVHLNLTQGRPLTGNKYPAELLDRNGRFPGIGALARRLLVGGWKYRDFIEQELKAQIEVVLDHEIAPTHLNSHQYVDTFPVVASLVPGLLGRYAIPVARVPWERNLSRTTLFYRFEPVNWCLALVKRMFAFQHLLQIGRRGIAHPRAFFGTSHAGRIDLPRMLMFIYAATDGITEIGIHPGLAAAGDTSDSNHDGWHDPLAALRPNELALLTSPELALLLEMHEIHLGRLSDLTSRSVVPAAA